MVIMIIRNAILNHDRTAPTRKYYDFVKAEKTRESGLKHL